jgi:hypothetical protein
MSKFISFIVTCGGDAGWRFSNGDEWCSSPGQLLFDADLWTPQQIKKAFNDIWFKYFTGRTGFTLSETMDKGYALLIPFINEHDGVYVNDAFKGDSWGCKLGFGKADKKKRIKPGEKDIVVAWELHGSKRCAYSEKYHKYCDEQREARSKRY